MPPFEAYGLTAYRVGGALLATLDMGDMPVLTIGVAARNRAGFALWGMLAELLAKVSGASAPPYPEAPWCGAVMLTPAADQRWIGDFERCIAWAWLEGKLRE